MSMGGNCSNATPGALTRFGPAKRNGLARSDHTGSTSMLRPAAWISTVAWPIIVIRRPSTRRSGATWRPGIVAGHVAGEPPPQQLEEAAIGVRVVRIEEPLTVEMSRRRPAIIAVQHPANRRRPSHFATVERGAGPSLSKARRPGASEIAPEVPKVPRGAAALDRRPAVLSKLSHLTVLL